jgi:hypothetical protein
MHQRRLVVTGLEFVGANQEPKWIALDLPGNIATREPIERGLADLRSTVLILT